MPRYQLEFRHRIPMCEFFCYASHGWNSVLHFLNSKIISWNFPVSPDVSTLDNASLSFGIPSYNSNIRCLMLCKSRKFSWADEAARQILFQAMLAWNFVMECQNSNAICFNFLGAPDGRRMTNPKQLSGIPLRNSYIRFLLLCKSRNFPKLTKLHAKYNSEQCLFGICPGFPELENYFFKFSWTAGWQDIKKCHAINWNSVMEFQHAIPFVVQVTGGILFCISGTRKLFLQIFLSRRMAEY